MVYTSDASRPSFTAFVGELASADIWHHRLGHPNYAVVRTVIQDNKLPVSSLKFSVY
jgi:GAG-pre-integrase domain